MNTNLVDRYSIPIVTARSAVYHKHGASTPYSDLVGYIRIEADNLERARLMLVAYPHFEAGGTVEIRQLRQSD